MKNPHVFFLLSLMMLIGCATREKENASNSDSLTVIRDVPQDSASDQLSLEKVSLPTPKPFNKPDSQSLVLVNYSPKERTKPTQGNVQQIDSTDAGIIYPTKEKLVNLKSEPRENFTAIEEDNTYYQEAVIEISDSTDTENGVSWDDGAFPVVEAKLVDSTDAVLVYPAGERLINLNSGPGENFGAVEEDSMHQETDMEMPIAIDSETIYAEIGSSTQEKKNAYDSDSLATTRDSTLTKTAPFPALHPIDKFDNLNFLVLKHYFPEEGIKPLENDIQLIDSTCAVLIYPTKEQLASLKSELGENFSAVEEDYMYYQETAIQMLDSIDIETIYAEKRHLTFYGENFQPITIDIRKEGAPPWNLIFFNERKEPQLVPISDLSHQKIIEYFDIIPEKKNLYSAIPLE